VHAYIPCFPWLFAEKSIDKLYYTEAELPKYFKKVIRTYQPRRDTSYLNNYKTPWSIFGSSTQKKLEGRIRC
jgi:hypothetical protein